MKKVHTLAQVQGGVGIEAWIKPVCTCGWTGNKHHAWTNYQHSNCREEGERHLDTMRKQREAAK